jgi:pilus assembly protein FimV
VNKQALSLAVFIAGAYPAASSALGLGDIESSSHLNQPLRAKIELLAGTPSDASQLQVRLASPEVFNRVGVARPDFLGSLQFTPTVQNGKPVILVTSNAPIQEPFVNFLLEVSWPQGQLLKEYTVMLDPPVLMQPGNTVAGEASVRAEPKAAGTVRRSQVQTQTQQQAAADSAPQQQDTVSAPRQQTGGNRTYRVRPGDTLFGVASRLQRPGVSNDQMMMALFRANPGAFAGSNINNLMSGSVLKAPSGSDIGSTSRAEARRQIRQQNAEWREFRQSLAKNTVPQKAATATSTSSAPGKQTTARTPDNARLEVLGAKAGESTDKNAAVAAGNAKLAEIEKQFALAQESLTARLKENDELKSRVTDLESMMSKKNRLIALRNDQLAGLQKQLSENGIAVPPLADMNEAGDIVNGQPATPAVPNEGRDIQTHVANVAGQDANTVLRGEVPVANVNGSASVPVTPPVNAAMPVTQPVAPPVNGAAPPVTPPAPVVQPQPAPVSQVKPAIIPVTPPKNASGADKVSPRAFADQADKEGDLLGLLTSPLALQIGAGSLALLLLLWLLGRRRKPEDLGKRTDAVIDDGYHDDVPTKDFDVNQLGAQLDQAEKTHNSKDYSSYDDSLDDPFGTGSNDAWGTQPTTKPTQPTEVKDKNSTHGEVSPPTTPVVVSGHPEDDLLTEANVYIAYGLYQQAESELKKGIERQPDNAAYRHKLLECYFAANNREAFDRQAEQFVAMPGQDREALWKSIAEWGRKISPDNVLYQGELMKANEGGLKAAAVTAAVGGAGAALMAVAVNAADTRTEDVAAHNTLHEPEVASAPPQDIIAVDATSDGMGDFSLDDMDFGDIDLDKLLNDDERPVTPLAALSDVNAGAKSGNVKDDFDFDFDFDLGEAEPAAKSVETPVSLVKEPVVASPAAEPAMADFSLDDDNLLDFDLDMDFNSEPVSEVAAEQTPPAQPVALVDMPDLLDEPVAMAMVAKAAESKAAPHIANLNLHLDSNSGLDRILPKDTFYAPATGDDNWLGDIDDALSFLDFPDEEIDLHEAHISTKLDLARAYLDMGDIEGARSTLEEVMVEGNDDQRREAEVLLHQTG